MVDLARWLGECLDEDERIARRAGDSFRQIGETGVIVATEGDRAEECASANWAGVAEHIVAWDPARVLREIDAKRQLLARYEELLAESKAQGLVLSDVGEEYKYVILPGLAAVYSDRPGYAEAVASVE